MLPYTHRPVPGCQQDFCWSPRFSTESPHAETASLGLLLGKLK